MFRKLLSTATFRLLSKYLAWNFLKCSIDFWGIEKQSNVLPTSNWNEKQKDAIKSSFSPTLGKQFFLLQRKSCKLWFYLAATSQVKCTPAVHKGTYYGSIMNMCFHQDLLFAFPSALTAQELNNSLVRIGDTKLQTACSSLLYIIQ